MYCNIKIKNSDYNCYFNTNNKTNLQPLILLHGWGVDSLIYQNIIAVPSASHIITVSS